MHIKSWIKESLARTGYEIKRVKPYIIQPWDEDKPFNRLMQTVYDHSLVDKVRCYMLYQLSRQALGLQGDVAEIGVYKGGTARMLAKVFEPKKKNVHLFDTFAGMPPCDAERDLHHEGDFSDTSLEGVQKYLSDCPNVRFYQGFFPATSKPVEGKRFCFVHIDVDIYRSVLDCCAFFYPRMEKGGVMIFDDYGSLSCPGAKTSVDEFFCDKPEKPCYLLTGQSVVIRF